MKTKKVTKNINQKGNTYYANFTNIQGKRIRKSLGKDLAQAKIQVLQLIANPEIQDVRPDEPTSKIKSVNILNALEQFIEYWYGIKDALKRPKWKQWTSERQAQDVMQTLVKLIEYSGIKTLKTIRFCHLESYLTSRSHEIKAGTYNKHVQHFNRFFEYCINQEWIQVNPARKLRKQKATTPFRYHLKDDEIQMVLGNAGDYRSFLIIALATGLRACDLWTLATQDFEVINNTMYLKIWEKKTKAFLYIPIHVEAREIVDGANAGRLFPNADEEFWRNAVLRNLQNNWSCSYCRKWNIRLHTLRHTFAIRAGAAGITKETLQQLLGHSSIKTTEVYFNQLPKEVLKDELKKLPDLPK